MIQKHKIALDVGDVRIGVAVSDLLGITANPRETYVRKKGDTAADIVYFCEYAKKEDADAFVLGLPKTWTARKGTERWSRVSLAICLKRQAESPCIIRTKGSLRCRQSVCSLTRT